MPRHMRSPSTEAVDASYSTHFHLNFGTPPDDPVEGLRMSQAYEHRPVMVDEVVQLLELVPPGLFVDTTVGGGGHASAVLAAHSGVRLLGLDRDSAAIEAAQAALAQWMNRVQLNRVRFDELAPLVAQSGLPLTAVLFDLGVSSPQLERASRGFSYRLDGPLDMRMDTSQSLRAGDLVNGAEIGELARVLAVGGEHRFASRVARAIVGARPITTTSQLAEVIREAIPAATRRTGRHPARKAFQALRIAVNSELVALESALDSALSLLAPGGRCVVISYHSGEDRIVKTRFVSAVSGNCTCPTGLPCVCGAVPQVRLLNKRARRPSDSEVAINPRATSARLRAVEKLETLGQGSMS